MIGKIKNTLNYILSPKVCLVCKGLIENNNLLENPFINNPDPNRQTQIQNYICNKCYYNLPLNLNINDTKIEILKNISINDLYIDNFYALIDNKLDDRYIQIIYELKYSKRQNIAELIGELMAPMLIKNKDNNENNENYDYLIPVPIHNARLRFRGFNQAELIANQISKITKIPVNILIDRKINNQTQTKLTQIERKLNISNVFKATNQIENLKPQELQNKNALIIDDVLTTGATVNSIAKELKNIGFNKIDVATFIKA